MRKASAQNMDMESETPEPAVKGGARARKAASAFRTISEVADELGVQQHVLRFWETKFSQVKPLKRGGGRRYYRPEDVALLQTIHRLLYTEGYTIKGVQKLLKGQGRQQIISGDLAQQNEAPVAQKPVVAAVPAPRPVAVEPTQARPASGLSDKQRMILEAMLGDLKDLRKMVRGEE